ARGRKDGRAGEVGQIRRRGRGGGRGANAPCGTGAPAHRRQAPPPRRPGGGGGGGRRGGGRARRVKAQGGWHRSPTGVVRRTLEAAFEDNIPFLAGALSFDLLLTIIPFVAVLLAMVWYPVEHQVTTQQVDLHELLARLLPSTLGGGTDA